MSFVVMLMCLEGVLGEDQNNEEKRQLHVSERRVGSGYPWVLANLAGSCHVVLVIMFAPKRY